MPVTQASLTHEALPVVIVMLARRPLLFAIAVVDEVGYSIQSQNQTYNQCFHNTIIRNNIKKLWCKQQINEGYQQKNGGKTDLILNYIESITIFYKKYIIFTP